MPKRSKIIIQDNAVYEFEPGPNGHMTKHPVDSNAYIYSVPRPKERPSLIDIDEMRSRPRARTIGPKKRIDVGSARG